MNDGHDFGTMSFVSVDDFEGHREGDNSWFIMFYPSGRFPLFLVAAGDRHDFGTMSLAFGRRGRPT